MHQKLVILVFVGTFVLAGDFAQVRAETSCDYQQAVSDDNPLHWWKLDDAASPYLDAGSGTVAHGLGVGADVPAQTPLVTQAGTACIRCEQNESDCVRVSSGVEEMNTCWDSGECEDRAVELWFSPQQLTGIQALWEEGDSSTGFSIHLDGSVVYCSAWEGATGCQGGNQQHLSHGGIVEGQTYHVVLTWSDTADEMGCWLNGTEQATTNLLWEMRNHGTGTGIGSSTGAACSHQSAGLPTFDGLIDEVAVWDRVLTSTEIFTHYAKGTGDCEPGTPTVGPDPTPTRTPGSICTGDCNENAEVTVDELVRGVNIALGTALVAECPAFDRNGDQSVTVDELVQGVNAALQGC